MTYVLAVNPDGTTIIQVDFSDEGVALTGETRIKGGEAEALAYLPIFEADLRRNYAELFPLPELPEPTPGGELL
jgi:hypothetical protein